MDHDKVVVELKECLDHMKDMRTVLVEAIDCINRLYASLSFEHNRNNDLEQEVSRLKKLLDELSEESDGGKCEPVEEIVEEPDPICVGDECEAYATQYNDRPRKLLGKVVVTRVPDCSDGLYDTVFVSAEDPDFMEAGVTAYIHESDLKKTGRRITVPFDVIMMMSLLNGSREKEGLKDE